MNRVSCCGSSEQFPSSVPPIPDSTAFPLLCAGLDADEMLWMLRPIRMHRPGAKAKPNAIVIAERVWSRPCAGSTMTESHTNIQHVPARTYLHQPGRIPVRNIESVTSWRDWSRSCRTYQNDFSRLYLCRIRRGARRHRRARTRRALAR